MYLSAVIPAENRPRVFKAKTCVWCRQNFQPRAAAHKM